MKNLIAPKPNDYILISLKNGKEVFGIIKEILETVIVLQPTKKKCLAIVAFEEISCYFLTSKEISDYLGDDPPLKKAKDKEREKIESIKELRERQKDIEKEEFKAKLTNFTPTNYDVTYGTPARINNAIPIKK